MNDKEILEKIHDAHEDCGFTAPVNVIVERGLKRARYDQDKKSRASERKDVIKEIREGVEKIIMEHAEHTEYHNIEGNKMSCLDVVLIEFRALLDKLEKKEMEQG